MRNATISFWASLMIAVLLSGCALLGGSKKVDLRLDLEVGDDYTLEIINDQYIQQTVMGNAQTIDQTIGYTYRQEVLDRSEDGIYTIEVTYERVVYEQASPMGSIAYDSQDPPENIAPQAIGFAATTGKSFTMTMNQQGKVLAVMGVDSLIDQIFEEVSAQRSIDPQMRLTLKQQFGESSIKSNMTTLSGYYPEKPIKVGEHWEVVEDRKATTALHLETDYVLSKAEDGVLTLGAKSEITPIEGAPPTKMGEMELSYQLAGQQSGILQVNRSTGLLKEGTLTQNLSGNISMRGGSMGEMEWPILIETKILIKQL